MAKIDVLRNELKSKRHLLNDLKNSGISSISNNHVEIIDSDRCLGLLLKPAVFRIKETIHSLENEINKLSDELIARYTSRLNTVLKSKPLLDNLKVYVDFEDGKFNLLCVDSSMSGVDINYLRDYAKLIHADGICYNRVINHLY